MPRFSADLEYESLRDELHQDKKYVFERPIIIIGVIVTAMNLVDKGMFCGLAFGLVVLLLFNFWFTVNRLRSMARIVAYIGVKLEDDACGEWHGWETYLRHQRKWTKRNSKDLQRIVSEGLETAAIPEHILYYRPIYYLHVGGVAFACLTAICYALANPCTSCMCCAIGTAAASAAFGLYAGRERPSEIRQLSERSRVIWREVFKDMKSSGG